MASYRARLDHIAARLSSPPAPARVRQPGDGRLRHPLRGLALCKIHHAAYDANVLGIRPDYVVQIHHRLLDEIDGPMLRHGLQGHHGQNLMRLPARRADRPDVDRLTHRYDQFRVA
jgi:hypothetical protein